MKYLLFSFILCCTAVHAQFSALELSLGVDHYLDDDIPPFSKRSDFIGAFGTLDLAYERSLSKNLAITGKAGFSFYSRNFLDGSDPTSSFLPRHMRVNYYWKLGTGIRYFVYDNYSGFFVESEIRTHFLLQADDRFDVVDLAGRRSREEISLKEYYNSITPSLHFGIGYSFQLWKQFKGYVFWGKLWRFADYYSFDNPQSPLVNHGRLGIRYLF